MRSKQKLIDIVFEIYRKLYKQAIPQADFDELMKKGETKKERWFMKYYVSEEDTDKIVNKILKKYKCSRFEKDQIMFEIYLGCSPTSNKGAWKNVK